MAGEDAFEKQAAAMAAPPPKKFVPGIRSIVYAFILFLVFGLAAGQVGIWSWVLQHHGNIKRVYDYPSREIMQTGNLLFFSGLLTLVVALGAIVLPLFFSAFLWFCIFVFNIVGAAIFTVHVPFSATSSSTSDPSWARFAGEYKYWVAMEAVSWCLMGLTFILFVAVAADAAMAKNKRHYLLGQ
ncbi:hypothetical protein JCM11641_002011 [Rhodosporidiobolus odoratus]